MSKHRYTDAVCIIILILTLLVTVLFMNGERLGLQVIRDQDAETYSGSEYFTENDLDGTWDTSGATVITLDGDTASVSGSGAYVLDGSVYIVQSGYYTVSGSLTDGSLIVDAESYSKVWILLNGVDIACADDACIRVDQADKVFLTLAEGSDNSLVSGDTYSEEALADGTDGVIYAHDDLTVNGSGSLTITAACEHGISANDELTITGGTLTITAPEDAIHTNDGFAFTGADLTLTAGDDGITTDGFVYVESGTITMEECYEGIEALTIEIAGGDITIYAGDDGMNARDSSATGTMGMVPAFMETADGTDTAEETDTAEATDTADARETEIWIRISGGSVTIINENGRDADGLDSNGDIYIEGGTVRISLPGEGGNCAIDPGTESGGGAYVTGGTVIACGSSAMAEMFAESSEQASVMYTASGEAGTEVSLTDAAGTTLLSWEVPGTYTSVIFSCPELTQGQTYTLTADGQTEEITLESMVSYAGSASAGASGMGIPQGDFPRGGFFQGDPSHNANDSVQEAGESSNQDGTDEMTGPTFGGDEMPENMPSFEEGEMPEDMPALEEGEMPAGRHSRGSGGHRRPGHGETSEDMSSMEDGEQPSMEEGTGPSEMPAMDRAEETAAAATEAETTVDPQQTAALIAASAITLLIGILIAARHRSFSV